ncbi:MAG: FliM/FliN family flagellar motor switch protein [Planctomycetes bacterium]|nr:FliM/FliN family flagellar motor switch protein [Planctomycetota bacterium]
MPQSPGAPHIFPSPSKSIPDDLPPESSLERALPLQLPIIAILGEKQMSMEEVLNLTKDAVITFKKHNSEPLDLYVNNCRIGSGKAIKVGQRFGIYITDIGSVQEMIRKLG